jgi:hypothetical protein
MVGFWQVSKNGNSTLWPCYFGKCLLTVGGDEQQETAISPSILNIFVAHFLHCIPYMYVHSSMMLECKISCSLLTTVMSNKWQYLHQYWLFVWRIFWYVPIRHTSECESYIPIMPQVKLVCSLSVTMSSHISTKTRVS